MRPEILTTSTQLTGLIGFFLLASGCTLLLPDKPDASDSYQPTEKILQQFNNHSQRLNDFDNWVISGRVGVKGPHGAFTGNFKWIQHQNTFSITISGPLGQGTSTIQGNSHEVILTNGKTGEISQGNPQLLMNQALGWSLPMQYIQLWIKGHPGVNMEKLQITKNKNIILDNNTSTTALTTKVSLNNENTLALLEREHWRFEYNRYKPYENKVYNVSLPHKVIASNTNLTLTFIIKNWSKQTP